MIATCRQGLGPEEALLHHVWRSVQISTCNWSETQMSLALVGLFQGLDRKAIRMLAMSSDSSRSSLVVPLVLQQHAVQVYVQSVPVIWWMPVTKVIDVRHHCSPRTMDGVHQHGAHEAAEPCSPRPPTPVINNKFKQPPSSMNVSCS
ncbi:unnamed protein product [Phytophthora lilii]|uniref:Unnamed protein product n=1 Tax=Phytophthora lilii TaxID=2077276 RepID=A0A9W6U739_9STRA|nr:unnamed protein product [Phytophthora lilii]